MDHQNQSACGAGEAEHKATGGGAGWIYSPGEGAQRWQGKDGPRNRSADGWLRSAVIWSQGRGCAAAADGGQPGWVAKCT